MNETQTSQNKALPLGHPIFILMEEHKIILQFSEDLKDLSTQLKKLKNFDSAGSELKRLHELVSHFKNSSSHYLREENVLFPYLEKKGITQPPAMMWTEHDQIRAIEKELYQTIALQKELDLKDFFKKNEEIAIALYEMLSTHFHKENHVLFPMSLQAIQENEWKEIEEQFNQIGYCPFTPESIRPTQASYRKPSTQQNPDGMIYFETGSLSIKELEGLLNALPVEITFVDKNDTFRFFNKPKEVTFVRTTAAIGRKVQQCHPQKSVHLVNQILEDFKSGKKNFVEFWINMGAKTIYIRYFAIRDEKGEYQGCIEVTQNITPIKKIEGQKRLL